MNGSEDQSAPFVSQRTVGDALVTLITDGTLSIPLASWLNVPFEETRQAIPAADAEGVLHDRGLITALLRVDDNVVLVDTGAGDVAADARLVTSFGFQPSPGVEAGLASLGLTLEDVTHVLLTHAHGDHVAGATAEREGVLYPRYPNAQYYLNRLDWQGGNPQSMASEDAIPHVAALDAAGVLTLVDGDEEIVPGVAMILTGGESPGHSIVHLTQIGAHFYFLGDLIHDSAEALHPDWIMHGRDAIALERARLRFTEEASVASALVAYTHASFPGWSKVQREGETYRWIEV